MKIKKVIISIGGNIRSDEGFHPIDIALKAIHIMKDFSINVKKQSRWYETEPIPKSDQPNFYNCIIIAKTTLNELDVLKSLHKIEHMFGRRRKEVNESRVIDLDLIDYSNKILKNTEIIIPHPRAHQRRFVMEPLAELDQNWFHPILKKNVNKILIGLKDQKIKIYREKIII